EQKLSLTSCTQSSVAFGGVCTRAIDNNTNQAWSSGSCTHTEGGIPNQWWEAQLLRQSIVSHVVIYNRQNASHRLSNFELLVDGVQCRSVNVSVPFSVGNFTCQMAGSSIRVQSRRSDALTLCDPILWNLVMNELLSSPLPDPVQEIGYTWTITLGSSTLPNAGHSAAVSRSLLESKPFLSAVLMSSALVSSAARFELQLAECFGFYSVQNKAGPCGLFNATAFYWKSSWTSAGSEQQFDVFVIDGIQSSVLYSEFVVEAIDGNNNPSYSAGSCTHTDQFPNQWWEAELLQPSIVTHVVLYNRQDCCVERLNNFSLLVNDAVCAQVSRSTPFSVGNFSWLGAGSRIRIENNLNDALCICEFEAFGIYFP
uniref:FTP domain-containing protein n=1 Tax=Macrostomum lignano TaxID=282301 RepID=A0A1I8J772_9PLAT